MGIYDRDYARGPEEGFQLTAPRTAAMQILAATAAVYVAQLVAPIVTELGMLSADWPTRPWQAYELLTYGFLHSTGDVAHILVNMAMLWMFGTELERRYGRREFIALYLLAIVFAGVVWSLIEWGTGDPAQNTPRLLGASGAISALFVLYALNFPHRQVLFMFFLPMPMWVAALIGVMFDASGAMSRSGNVAYTAHLAGALYGYLCYRYPWARGADLVARVGALFGPRKPQLRVHHPDPEEALGEQVDRILEKIQTQGQDSLTRSERKILEKASRQYQQRRKP
jgi:membrane associated rhomboid family serine protease